MTARPLPIGLDVGTRRVKAVQAVRRAGTATIIAAASFPRREPDAPLSAGEAERIGAALDRLGFLGRRCVLGVPRAALLTAELELPPAGSGAPREQIARLELARVHRREPSGFEIGVWEVPAPERSGPGAHALAAACPHESAEALLAPLEESGLEVAALDHPGWALARLRTGAGATAMLDLGWTAAVLVLAHRGAVLYERVIEGGSLTGLHARLCEQTGLDGRVVDELLALDTWPAHESSRRGRQFLDRAVRCANEFAETVSRELRLSLDYLSRRFPGSDGSGAPAVELVGGGASCAIIAEHLQRQCPAGVRAVRPSDSLGADEAALQTSSSPALCLAAGLALREDTP